MNGVLLINKPQGPTSHDVVARVRRAARTKRVGHAGTLDPMATGLLVCCIDTATRIVPYLIGMSKDYTGEMILGAASDTYDAEGQVTPVKPPPEELDLDTLREVFRAHTGVVEQTAPPYSAVKVRGRKLYDYARNGEEAPIKKRNVLVEQFEPLRYLPPAVTFAARVSSGTYIRSLAHEAGRDLGCGAYLSKLCRTRVGGFSIDDAVTLESIEDDPDFLAESLLTIPQALVHMPKILLLPHAEARLRHGNAFTVADILECEGPQPVGAPTLVLSDDGEAMAIVQADSAEGAYRPLCVLVSG